MASIKIDKTAIVENIAQDTIRDHDVRLVAIEANTPITMLYEGNDRVCAVSMSNELAMIPHDIVDNLLRALLSIILEEFPFIFTFQYLQ